MVNNDDDTIIHIETYSSEGKSKFRSKIVFFDALNYLNVQKSSQVLNKENKMSFYRANLNGLKKSFSETFENNISEYSRTQANLSKEDHVN